MTPYQFHDTVVLRHPVYSFKQFNEENLADKLQDPFFRDAVYLCSPTVFDELKKNDFNHAKLNGKLKNTILKYLNRMCYRPTPFALCAAVSTVKWSDGAGDIILDSEKFIPQVKLSYAKSLQVATATSPTTKHQLRLKVNATLYKSRKQVRYIKSTDGDSDKIAFYISSADITTPLSKVLRFAAVERTAEDILTFIVRKLNCTSAEASEYLQSLSEEQILIDVSAPHITGKDYLDGLNITTSPNNYIDDSSVYIDLKKIINTPTLANYLGQYCKSLQKNDLYVNLKSTLGSASINTAHQKAILDGLHCLSKFNQLFVPQGISQFVQQFNKKFEGQTIPLLLALDPELGIGYSELTSGSESLNFADDIGWAKARMGSDTVKWGQVQSLILKKWMTGGKYEPVKLSTDDLVIIEQYEQNKLPSTLSVMFRLAGEKVFIEQVAGVTAASLIGRFTPVNTEINALASDIALHETNFNPDIIYAEIVHVCHKQTANIDRRNHIYPYEIVILTPSVLDEHHQIPLSDLYVSVQNNEVILWSARHKKRVIPRLSSAFNYQRDDLAAFRFLCDLQHIGVQTNFNFALENLYPGLDFYPRIEFEQAILQCAQWHLDKEVVAPVINEKDRQKRLDDFIQLRQQLQLCKYIALTQHDHQLVFNLDNLAEVDFFLETIQPLKKVVIKEVLTKTINNPVLFNEANEGIASQFIATLYHKQAVYQPKTLNLPAFKKQTVRSFSPGTEWLYFKLYSHEARTNELIGTIIHQTINRAFKHDLITQWFFTRYNDPDHHIRFRVKVRSGKHQSVIDLVSQAASTYQKQGVLSNVIIDTYHRELERYPDIDAFEDIFHHSSVWVSSYLNRAWQELTEADCLSFAFLTTRDLLRAAGFSDDERMDYLTSIISAFSNEFSHVPELKYQLDLSYRKHKSLLMKLKGARDLQAQYKVHKIAETNNKSMAAYFDQIRTLPIQTKFKHLADIIHMHLNRIFADQPREQEFTLYYMLLKYEKSSKYLNQAV